MDAWESAEKAKLPDSFMFGQIVFDMWFCVLKKGQGKVPFDPGVHGEGEKRVSITINFTPMPRLDGSTWQFAPRNMIAESPEWVRVVNPSIAALSHTPLSLNNRYVKIAIVPAGRKYIDPKTNEEREATTVKFLEVYPDETACQAAADAAYSGARHDEPAFIDPATGETMTAASAAPAPASNIAMETARQFLKPLWTASGKSVEKFAGLIASNPLVATYFTINSPEVLNIIQAG